MSEMVRCPRCWDRFWTDNNTWVKCPGCGRRIVLDESFPYMDGGDAPRWYEHKEWIEEELHRPGWSV